MSRREAFWWSAVGVWLLTVLFWAPPPPVMFTEVPSVVTVPGGYRIFHDLVKKETRGVRRSLRHPGALPQEVRVLVLLSPSRGLEERDRQRLYEWVNGGGTLIVGHPIADATGIAHTSVFPEGVAAVTASRLAQDGALRDIRYVPSSDAHRRKVPVFKVRLEGMLDCAAVVSHGLAEDQDGRVVATIDPVGEGRLVQLADATILSNENIGFKRSHLFAAALMDEVGRDRIWAFDESHEGVEVQPSLTAMLGNGRLRELFLHGLLLLLFWYWWRSATLGRGRSAEPERRGRDLATMISDVAGFYQRARQGQWAVSRYAAYLRHFLERPDVTPAERQAGLLAVNEAERIAANPDSDLSARLHAVKKMADFRHQLTAVDERKPT